MGTSRANQLFEPRIGFKNLRYFLLKGFFGLGCSLMGKALRFFLGGWYISVWLVCLAFGCCVYVNGLFPVFLVNLQWRYGVVRYGGVFACSAVMIGTLLKQLVPLMERDFLWCMGSAEEVAVSVVILFLSRLSGGRLGGTWGLIVVVFSGSFLVTTQCRSALQSRIEVITELAYGTIPLLVWWRKWLKAVAFPVSSFATGLWLAGLAKHALGLQAFSLDALSAF